MKIASVHAAVSLEVEGTPFIIVFDPYSVRNIPSHTLPPRTKVIYAEQNGIADVPESVGGTLLHMAGERAPGDYYIPDVYEGTAPLGMQDIQKEPVRFVEDTYAQVDDVPEESSPRPAGNVVPAKKASLK